MRAVIIATQEIPPIHSAPNPAWSSATLEQPFIQRIIETLSAQGINEINLLVSAATREQFETWLGDGTRWGCHLHYQTVNDPQRPYAKLKTLSSMTEPLLLVHTGYLPLVDIKARRTVPAFYYAVAGPTGELEWTGWAWLSAAEIAALPGGVTTPLLELHLLSISRERSHIHKVSEWLSPCATQAAYAA